MLDSEFKQSDALVLEELQISGIRQLTAQHSGADVGEFELRPPGKSRRIEPDFKHCHLGPDRTGSGKRFNFTNVVDAHHTVVANTRGTRPNQPSSSSFGDTAYPAQAIRLNRHSSNSGPELPK